MKNLTGMNGEILHLLFRML